MQLSPRSKFLLLLGLFALPVVAAYVSYFGLRPAGHTNYGDLIAATPLKQGGGVQIDGSPIDLSTLRGKWIMLHVGPSACDADCVQQLYLMRQIRIAQGKEQFRIERVWVVTDDGKVDPELLREYPGQYVMRPMDTAWAEQFPAEQFRERHIYLVDPLGNLMLRFPAQPDPKRIMKDLKLLLKASQIG